MVGSTLSMAQSGHVPVKKPMPDVTDSMVVHYESLKNKYGKNKNVPPRYEKQIFYALSYFPELVNTKITFQIKKSKTGIIDTRPTIGGLFRNGNKRKYLVSIYESAKGRTRPQFAKADVNGQVGILGHEFCHILSFKNSTGLGLAGLGIAHVSTRFMDRYENKTDSLNIERGLGYQLVAWKQHLDEGFKAMARNHAPPSAKPTHERYMSVDRIRSVMTKSKAYQQE